MNNAVSELALQGLEAAGAGALTDYARALRNACEKTPPIYGQASFGDAFRRRAREPAWFAGLLLSDADLEGYSAQQLWRYADTLGAEHGDFATAIRKHARDESRHSRVFGNLLLTLFPTLDRPDFRDRLRAMAPDLGSELRLDTTDDRPYDELLNTAVLVNLFEIKALILIRLLTPVALAYCPEHQRNKVAAMLRVLAADEIEHIRYTAELLEAASRAGHGKYIRDAMADFQFTLDTTTADDLLGDARAIEVGP